MRALRIALNSISMIDVDDDLQSLRREIGESMTTVGMKDGAVMIADEDGMKKQYPHNDVASYVSGKHIYGTALIVGTDGDSFDDVPSQYNDLLTLGE